MDIIIGNEKQDGIDFRLTVKKFNGKLYISNKSLQSAILSNNCQIAIYNRTSEIPYKRMFRNNFYTLKNAINYIDNIHIKTRHLTMLLMMYIKQELESPNKINIY